MTESSTVPSRASPVAAAGWLVLAVGCGILGSGSGAVAAAAWLSPIFTLRFFRSQSTGRGALGLFLAGAVVLAIGWRVFPFGGAVGLAVFATVGALFGLVPFLADRWLGGDGASVRATLVYPLAATALEFFLGQGGDLGSWGATGYALVDQAPMLQLVGWTGLAGPAFLVGWVASAGNAWWAYGSAARRGVLLCAVVVGGVALASGLREAPAGGETIRVAAVGAPRWNGVPDDQRGVVLGGDPVTTDTLAVVRAHNAPGIDRLWATSDRAAAGGARLVAWSEGAATLWDQDEAGFTERAVAWSAAHDAVLVIGMVVLSTGEDRRIRNEAIVVTPSGGVAGRYAKAVPTPGVERSISHAGDGRLVPVDTPFGRIATVICYDLDFPRILAQATAADVDLVVAPAGDWPEVAEIHADMARFRAVEQGVAVLRPASAGRSTVVGPRGEVLAARTTDGTGDSLLFGEIPASGRVPTVYGRTGDLVGWGSVAGFLGMCLWAGVKRIKRGRTRTK